MWLGYTLLKSPEAVCSVRRSTFCSFHSNPLSPLWHTAVRSVWVKLRKICICMANSFVFTLLDLQFVCELSLYWCGMWLWNVCWSGMFVLGQCIYTSAFTGSLIIFAVFGCPVVCIPTQRGSLFKLLGGCLPALSSNTYTCHEDGLPGLCSQERLVPNISVQGGLLYAKFG